MMRIQFLGSLYIGEDGPVIPAENIEATIINGAKKSREGQLAKASLFAMKHSKLEYEGPRTPDELWNNESFHFYRMVKIGTSRVPSMRPVFDKWEIVVDINYDDTAVNIERVDEWLRIAGEQVGLGDWRPRYGRFSVERLNGKG